MRVFLTGATGFVGHHVAKALAAEGADLRLLTRKTSNLANLEGIRGETVVGDLSDPASLKPALSGCDAVVHVAADYRLWIPDPAAMYRSNVDGTRELLRLSREAGVKRFVYTSSVATMHFRTDGIVINEDTPVSLADMVGHYKRSKFLAEQEAIAAANGGQQVIILNPTTPIGPNDRKPTPTGRIFVDFLNSKFPAYVDTGLNLVDVSEVARAHVLALTKGTPGRRYIFTVRSRWRGTSRWRRAWRGRREECGSPVQLERGRWRRTSSCDRCAPLQAWGAARGHGCGR